MLRMAVHMSPFQQSRLMQVDGVPAGHGQPGDLSSRGRKTATPTPRAATEEISTAPAAVSFAILASGWNSSVHRSASASTTVFRASEVSTRPRAIRRQDLYTAYL